MRRAFLGPSLSGRLTLLSTPGEDWRVAQRQPGAGPLGSKLPVQVAQLEADSWHHPVPSSPQSPQSAPNLQHPPLPPPPPPPLPEIAPFMYRPDAVSCPSDQPPFVGAPGCRAEHA